MPEAEKKTKKGSGWLSVAVDYGPLIVFLAVYRFYAPQESEIAAEIAAIVKGTIGFIIAAICALIFSKWKLGRISPMLWFSTALIVGFGSLTIFFGDPTFVQLKPTIIYVVFGVVLLVGWKLGKPLLKILLEAAFEGLEESGWLKLSRNWGVFFLFLAVLNEVLRHFYNVDNGNFETWLWAKIWVFLPITFLFTFSQIPMLLKHGLDLEGEEEAITDIPPP
ncbi:inner membrane-spanning protein YciB [Altererythrobacter sp.]|uniref:inner membrane-spanning protein YciB n=1 Tax=Altererythrobacter sp. TaxID=1872480 RepID=UPI003D04ED4B